MHTTPAPLLHTRSGNKTSPVQSNQHSPHLWTVLRAANRCGRAASPRTSARARVLVPAAGHFLHERGFVGGARDGGVGHGFVVGHRHGEHEAGVRHEARALGEAEGAAQQARGRGPELGNTPATTNTTPYTYTSVSLSGGAKRGLGDCVDFASPLLCRRLRETLSSQIQPERPARFGTSAAEERALHAAL